MTTASSAYAIVRGLIEAAAPTSPTVGGSAVPLRWQNEDGGRLPNKPAPFIYTEFLTDPQFIASFGGGRGSNRYRNPAVINAYCFVPRGWGLAEATDLAEKVCAVFRSYRDSDISCTDATVYPLGAGASIKPVGLDSEVDNYFAATAEISLFFDQIG